MKSRPSEIFETYSKLMEEQAIPKTAQEKESKELKKYKSDTHPRSGSDTTEIIEKLYHNKPDQIKGMEYKTNIIEIAHPNPVVIAPSYDKLNGLVENENERHNIIRNILMNDPLPSGTIRFKKRAEQELAIELMKIANDMDNANQDELRILADECLMDLKKEAAGIGDFWDWLRGHGDEGAVGEGVAKGMGIGSVVGVILAPWTGGMSVPAGAVIGAAAGGLLSAIFNTTPKVKNVKENTKELLEQLVDLEKAVPEQSDFFGKIKSSMTKLIETADKYLAALNFIRGRMMENEQVFTNEKNEIAKSSQELSSLLTTIRKMHEEFNTRAQEGQFAKAKGSITPVYWFISDDIKDVSDAFVSLEQAIVNLQSTMKTIGDKALEATKEAPKPEEKPQTPAAAAEERTPNMMDYLKAPEGMGEKIREMLSGMGGFGK